MTKNKNNENQEDIKDINEKNDISEIVEDKPEIEQYLDAKDKLDTIKKQYKKLKSERKQIRKENIRSFVTYLWIIFGILILGFAGYLNIRDITYSKQVNAMPIIATKYESEYLKDYVRLSYVYVYENEAYSERSIIKIDDLDRLIESNTLMVNVNPKNPDKSYLEANNIEFLKIYILGLGFILLGVLNSALRKDKTNRTSNPSMNDETNN